MTTGSYIKDLRVPAPGTGSLYGVTVSRNWNGRDSLPPLPKLPKAPPIVAVRMKINRLGVMTYRTFKGPPLRVRTKRTQKKGSLPPNPYSMNEIYKNNGLLYLKDGRAFSCEEAGVNSNLGAIGYSDSNLYNKCVEELRERLLGSDFHGGIVAAEAHKVASLVTETAAKLALGLRHVKRLRFGDAIHVLTGAKPPKRELSRFTARAKKQTTSQNWLELQYGWLPLLHDVHAGAEALAHLHEGSSVMAFRIRKSNSTGTPRGKYPDPASSTAGVGLPVPDCTNVGVKSKESIQLIATVSSFDYATLSGFTDPLSIAWELVPYSFVFDWFIPVGSYFQALAASRSINGTFVITRVERQSIDAIKHSGNSFLGAGTYPHSRVSIQLNRTVSFVLPRIPPEIKPIVKIASVGHALNALALIFVRK